MTYMLRLLMRPEVTIGLLVAALLFHKIRLMQPRAKGPILFAVAQHDAAIFALMLLFYAAGCAAEEWGNGRRTPRSLSTILSKLCMAACVLVVVLYGADVFAFHFFTTRLYASDIVTFSWEPRAVLSVLRSFLRGTSGRPAWRLAVDVVLVVVLLRACYVLLVKPVRSPLRSLFLAASALPLVLLWLAPVPAYVYSFMDRPLYENFIECNHNFFFRNNFSDSFRAHLLATPLPETCGPGRHCRLNVILLIVESLSAYQSRFFSGVQDWTPRLDEIAQRETALTDFFANGWTTTGGVVSLLARTLPLVPELRGPRATVFRLMGGRGTSFAEYPDPPRPLPRVLANQGYATEFVAPGDLSFVGEDKWLSDVGFQKIVGQDDPRYAGQKLRGPFNSVPDSLLYEVALQELTQMPADRPYFMVVQTFWSHTPFLDPISGDLHGPEPVFRETDAQIGAFYDRLMAAGFFDKGLLFITGDHRAMDSYRKAEFERFGASAVARIPAVIVTRALPLPRVITQGFQQRDFGASIESLVDDRYCLGPQEGSFLSDPPKPPACIIHAMGVDRDLVFVKCGAAEGMVRAAGDATRFVSGAVPDEASLIQIIDRTRVRPVK